MTARQLQIVDGVQDQIWTIGPANSAGIIVAEMDRSRALRWRDVAGIRDRRAIPAHKVRPGPRGLRAFRACQDRKARPARRDRKGLKAPRGKKATPPRAFARFSPM